MRRALYRAMAHWCRRFMPELEPSMCAHVALKWANERMAADFNDLNDLNGHINAIVGIVNAQVRHDVVKLVKFYLRRLP